MKISIFTTITSPEKYQYAWKEALDSYLDFADEVVVVNGGESINDDRVKEVMLHWPTQWNWIELPKHLNAGLTVCSGDVIIKMDLDYMIHEEDHDDLRKSLKEMVDKDYMVGAFVKKNILNKKYAYQKSVLPNAINAKFKDQIRYGDAVNEQTDWCLPLKVEKDELNKDLPEGISFSKKEMAWLSCNIYNYDYFFRTKEVAKSEFWRFAQAYSTIPAFKDKWGATEEDAWQLFLNQMKGRTKNHALLDVDHPKYIRERVNNMTPDEFGFSNWDNFKNL